MKRRSLSVAREGGARSGAVLSRLAQPGALLAPLVGGSDFGVFALGDRRRRPAVIARVAEVKALLMDRRITPAPHRRDAYVLSETARPPARGAETKDFAFQIPTGAPERAAPPPAFTGPSRMLALVQEGAGQCWFQSFEIEAALRLWRDWEASAFALRGEAPLGELLGAGLGAEPASPKAAARQRFAAALKALPPGQQRLVHAACLKGEGLEALERRLGWPSRSAKVALKLALEGLSVHYSGV